MTSESPLARNALYSGMSSASNVLLIVLVIVAARVLGDTAFGQFSLALALASIFEMVTDLGLNSLIARNVSRDRRLTAAYLPNILAWKSVLSLVAMGLLVLAVNLMRQPPEVRTAAYILGGAIVLRSYKNTAYAFFQAHERFDLMLLTTYVERLSVLGACVAVLMLTRSLIGLAAAFALVRVPDLFFGYWLLHRKITPIRVGLGRTAWKLQMAAIPFGSYAIVMVVYAYIGTVVLSMMRTPEQVGWYSSAYKVYEGLTMFPYLFCVVLLPRLSRLFETDRDHHRSVSSRFLRYLVLLSLPLVVSVGLLATKVVLLLYGEEYLPAVPVLRVLLAAALLMFVNWTLNTVLFSANEERSVLRVATAGLLVMTVTNLVLVARLGPVGAACSVVVGELFMLVMLLRATGSVLFRVRIHVLAWRSAVACTSAGCILYLLNLDTAVGSVLLFILVYAVILVALGAAGPDERSAIRELFSSRAAPPR